MPLASASRRSRRIVLRLRDDSAARKSSKLPKPVLSQWNCWSVRSRKPRSPSSAPLRLGHERHMHAEKRRAACRVPPGLAPAPGRWRRRRRPVPPGARPGRRRERHCDLQFRVIAAAGALIGFGPAAIEHIFAERMGFKVARHDADERAAAVSATRCWGCQPVRAHADRETLERGQEGVRVNGLWRLHLRRRRPTRPQGFRRSRAVRGLRSSASAAMPDGLRTSLAAFALASGPFCGTCASRPKSLEDHLVGEPRRHCPILGAPHRPGEDRQPKHTPVPDAAQLPPDRHP